MGPLEVGAGEEPGCCAEDEDACGEEGVEKDLALADCGAGSGDGLAWGLKAVCEAAESGGSVGAGSRGKGHRWDEDSKVGEGLPGKAREIEQTAGPSTPLRYAQDDNF